MFWRAHAPVLLDVGPVLHPDDAVAGKMDALFNRWAPRDFLDVDSILNSGRYTRQELMAVAGEHNPGFSPELFVESLSYLRRILTENSRRTARVTSRSRACAEGSLTGKASCTRTGRKVGFLRP